MKWPPFDRARRGSPVQGDDEVEFFVQSIEPRAPRQYAQERTTRYYNYRTMDVYRRPLLALLEVLAQRPAVKDDAGVALRELFLKLKNFYDPRDRLSLSKAVADPRLRAKFMGLVLFFYGEDTPTRAEIAQALNDIDLRARSSAKRRIICATAERTP